MKKIIIAAALTTIATISSASEVGISAVRDYASHKDGMRVSASLGQIAGFTPQLSYTSIDKAYDRYAIGGQYTLTSVGPVALAVTGAGVYQNPVKGVNGYGITGGLKATVSLTKNVELVANAERFAGQNRISASNGTVTSLGANIKF